MHDIIQEKRPTNVSEDELLKALERADWKNHWRKVLEIVSTESTEYQKARAKSLEGVAQRVFL